MLRQCFENSRKIRWGIISVCIARPQSVPTPTESHTADALAFGSTPPEQLRYAIDADWHGEMPRSYWFNAAGVLTPGMIVRLSAGS